MTSSSSTPRQDPKDAEHATAPLKSPDEAVQHHSTPATRPTNQSASRIGAARPVRYDCYQRCRR